MVSTTPDRLFLLQSVRYIHGRLVARGQRGRGGILWRRGAPARSAVSTGIRGGSPGRSDASAPCRRSERSRSPPWPAAAGSQLLEPARRVADYGAGEDAGTTTM